MKFKFLVILFILALQANAQFSEVHLVSLQNGSLLLENGNHTNTWGYGYWDPDSSFMTLPAPLIIVQQYDSVALTMTNEALEAHTIHLHGLDVSQANDGVPQTSFSVLFGESTTYSFDANQAGTFLYHCHVTTTLHLTMGMYGMLVVERPDNLLFENGPGYNQSYYFLASDLEIETNDDPINAFPYHEIEPDYFMINGLSGSMLFQDDSNVITAEPGDSIALRLCNTAYSKTEFIFPTGSNPQVFMSDGRPLPQALITDTLEIYAGERYSVILYPEAGLSDYILVNYYYMENNEIAGNNFIGINNETFPVGLAEITKPPFIVYPNPTHNNFHIIGASGEIIRIYDMSGSLLLTKAIKNTDATINVSELNSGMYIIQNGNGTTKKLLKY